MTQRDPDVEVIRRHCPHYAAATEMLGRRWAAGVLRALVTGPARFSDIAAAIPGMTDKLLSQRLKDLEADGLVERHVHPGPPVRVEYRLTEKGDALSTILLDLNRWALKWIDLPADAETDDADLAGAVTGTGEVVAGGGDVGERAARRR